MEFALFPFHALRDTPDFPRLAEEHGGFPVCFHQRKRAACSHEMTENNPRRGVSEKKNHPENDGRPLDLFTRGGKDEKEMNPK